MSVSLFKRILSLVTSAATDAATAAGHADPDPAGTAAGLIGALVVPDVAGTAATIIGVAGANLTALGDTRLAYLDASIAAIPTVTPDAAGTLATFMGVGGANLNALPAPVGMALEVTLGVPADTDIATDIVNVAVQIDDIETEVETTTLSSGEGSIASGARAGEVLRHLVDQVGAAGVALTAIPDMAKDSTVAKEASLPPKITGILSAAADESHFTMDLAGFGPPEIALTLSTILIDNYLVTSGITFTSGVNVGETRVIQVWDYTTGETETSSAFPSTPGSTDTFVLTTSIIDVQEFASTLVVQALAADVGNASTASFGSLFGILGDPSTQNISTQIGYDAAGSVAANLGDASGDIITSIAAKLGNDSSSVMDRFIELLTEVETTTLGKGDGVFGDHNRSGLCLRVLVDTIGDTWSGHTLTTIVDKFGDDPATIKDRFDTLAAQSSSVSYAVGSPYLYVTPWNNKQTIVELTPDHRMVIDGIWLDLSEMTQNGTLTLEYKVDGTNYRIFSTEAWTTADDDGLYVSINCGISHDFRVSWTAGVSETADRNIWFEIVYRNTEQEPA